MMVCGSRPLILDSAERYPIESNGLPLRLCGGLDAKGQNVGEVGAFVVQKKVFNEKKRTRKEVEDLTE